jgi:RNA polymerase sigma-54 factor
MKYFFTTGYETEGGESMSNTSVKQSLAELISDENVKKPYSDQKIVEELGKKGIKIARRTVAKYREELNILPSHMRRSY